MRVDYFKTPGGETISINYSKSSRLFSATFSGEKLEYEKQDDLEAKLKELTKYEYKWQPVIEIEIENNKWPRGEVALKYDRYWISPYFETWRQSDWECFRIGDTPGGTWDYRDVHNNVIFWEKFNMPYRDLKKGVHIIHYSENVWENIMQIESLIELLADRLNESFGKEEFLERLKGPILKALPGGNE